MQKAALRRLDLVKRQRAPVGSMGQHMHSIVISGLSAAALAFGLTAPANAAEGALSSYLPGTAGDFGLALVPAPGLQLVNTLFIQSGNVERAVLQGEVNAGIDVDIVLDLAGAFVTLDKKVFGASYTFGALAVFGNANLEATLTGPNNTQFSVDDSSFNTADWAFVPIQLNWNVDNLHFKVAQTIVAPTGDYDIDERVNLGRNYWAFDTVAGFTYFNPEIGVEFSMQGGVQVNTENEATNYKTGAELHLDVTANMFLSETFALGPRAYVYNQVTGDSGSGALLGDFKSESAGVGAGFLWIPKFAEGRLSIAGKAMVDVHNENRFDSTYGYVTAGWKF